MRIIVAGLIACLPAILPAQQRDSYFDDYGAYERFVDDRIMSRGFVELIQVLGGRDEYTEEELKGLQTRFLSVYAADFTDRAVINERDLGAGFRQEMRVYWGEAAGYVYYYALLHQRPDALVVIQFNINSSVQPILQSF